MTNPSNRTTLLASVQKLIDGLTKHVATIATLLLGGKTMSNAQVVGLLQQVITAETQAITARAALQAAVQAAKNQRAASRQFLLDLRTTLRAMFSGQPDVLADFGLSTRKTPTKKAEAKVAAAIKAQATKKARGTDKGKVQRKQITGNVAGVEVTPVIEPVNPAPAPVAQPAPVVQPSVAPAPPQAPAAPPAGPPAQPKPQS